MNTPFHLDDDVALITGGATGIGFATARCMVASGARVVIVGRREAELRRAAKELGKAAAWEVYDVTQTERAPAFVEKLTARMGRITIVVNNAGIHHKAPAVETSEADFTRMLQTHLVGAFALTRAVVPQMIERKSGAVIFISSLTALIGLPQIVAYTAAKAAQCGIVRALATEWSPHGIRVNAIATGWTDTQLFRRGMEKDPARFAKILPRTPLNRLGTPEDTGWAAVYLASSAASFITGVTLPVDGGAGTGF